MCVGVTLWFGCGGVVSVCRLKLIHPSSGVCDLCAELFHRLYCSGSMCVGVTLWFDWGYMIYCDEDLSFS